MQKILLSIILVLLFMQPVQAKEVQMEGYLTGDHIYHACKRYFVHLFNTSENTARKATCRGYFYGIGSTALSLQQKNKNKTCLPDNIATDTIIRVYIDWAETNPDKLSLFSSDAVLESLNERYPCTG